MPNTMNYSTCRTKKIKSLYVEKEAFCNPLMIEKMTVDASSLMNSSLCFIYPPSSLYIYPILLSSFYLGFKSNLKGDIAIIRGNIKAIQKK